jgi:hypothetical protein
LPQAQHTATLPTRKTLHLSIKVLHNRLFKKNKMKKTLQNLIIGLLFLTINSNAQTTILITDAAKKNIIDCKIFGSSNLKDNQESIDADGLHYGKCMTLNLVSRVDSALFIFIENGLMLMCDDTTTQDMIITKPIYVNLEPRQQKEVQLYAMCSEIHDGAPNIFTDYKIGSIADKNLVSIANSIDEMLMNNVAGQGAIWAYTDQAEEGALRNYGATDNSLNLTIEILNKAGVFTKLNPLVPDTVVHKSYIKSVKDYQKDDSLYSFNKYVVYGASGVLLFFIATTVVLIFIKRKSKDNKPTI